MNRLSRIGVLAVQALVASSCASVPATQQGVPADATPQAAPPASAANAPATRRIQTVIECPDAGEASPRPGLSPAPFEQVAKLPTGSSLHLDFKARKHLDKGQLPEADKLYFEDGVPFDLRFVDGPAFAIVDADGSDGEMVVALPEGYYDAYFGGTGKPGGTLTVSEPMFFQSQTARIAAGQDAWSRIGIRKLPEPGGYGDYVVRLSPQGLTGLSGRWFPLDAAEVPVPPVPPTPPSVTQLSGPDQAQPGATVTVNATVNDLNHDPLTYIWSATNPDGSAASAPSGEASATWSAPKTAGTYWLSLTVEDPYFSTKTCQPLPVVVPNMCPEATVSGPSEAQPGTTITLEGAATDANDDALTWRWETAGGTLSADGATATWKAPARAGTYTLKALVDDGHGCVTPVEHAVTVPNFCPEAALTRTGGGTLPTTVNAGATVGLTGTATDGNGDAVTWKWTQTGGALTPATGAATTWTAPATAGTYTVTGTASDGACETPVSHTITVLAPTPAPSPTPPPSNSVVKEWTLSYPADRIAVGPNGNAWVTHPDYDRVTQLRGTGGTVGNWDAGGPPVDIAVTGGNNAWMTLETGYARFMTDGTGAIRQHLYIGSNPSDIAVDPVSNSAYAAITGENKIAYLFGTNWVYWWPTTNGPVGIDVAEDGHVWTNIWGYGTSNQAIRKFQPNIGNRSTASATYLTGAGPRDIKVDRVNDRIWVVCEDTNVMTVLNANGTRVVPDFNWSTASVKNHTDLAVDHLGNGYIAMGSLMRKYSPQGVLLRDFGPARGVTVDPQGYIWYTSGNKVYKMTP